MENTCKLPRRKGPTKKVDPGVSMTKQSQKEQCDVNNILKKFRNSGAVTHVQARTPYFGDVSLVGDYQYGRNLILQAEQNFNSFPSRVRKRFDNNPENMLKFLSDKKNLDEAVELGLVDLKNSDGQIVTKEVMAEKKKASVKAPPPPGKEIIPSPEQIAQYLKDTAK